MMFALVLNVFHDALQIRFTYGEPAISVLPTEPSQIGKLYVNPFRRIAFEAFCDLEWRQRRRSHNQLVNMIVVATILYSGHFVFAIDPANVCSDALFNFWSDETNSVLCAENDVIEQ